MLKKMRRRFICAAMAAFTTVVLILLFCINLWHYSAVTGQLRGTMDILENVDGGETSPDNILSLNVKFGPFSREVQYMIRFFIVYCDASGEVQSTNQDFIASVSEEDAAVFAEYALKSGKEEGFYRGYRFRAVAQDSGTMLIFLNAERELQNLRAMFFATLLVSACSLAAVFLLVFLFSKRAIAPYARNIETQKRFITDASHELKTPLTSISTSADVLAMEYGDDEWIQNIQAQTSRLAKLTANLVTLSRLDEAQPFPERAEFSLSDAVWEIAEPFANLAAAKGREYVQRIEDGLQMVGDKAAIQQMVSLLLDNAIKYSDEHGKIRLDVGRKHRKLEIRVYNTCRLPEDIDMSKLFDRFYRPDQSRSKETGGSGVGLSIAKSTAEAHGGTISAETNKGNGLTFIVRL